MSPRLMFEQELEQLKDKVAEMGDCAQCSYDRLLFAVKENDRETIGQLLDNDRQMMDMLRSIEAGCLALLTKQQPVARDLRLVSAALKVVTDIERIGDHVSDMAELFLRRRDGFGGEECDKQLISMMGEAGSMLRESMEAFVEGDVQTAKMVVDSDDAVDDLFNLVKESMMEAIHAHSLDADRVVDNLMIAKYLEKVGDHAVNIAKWAVFQMTGELEGREIY